MKRFAFPNNQDGFQASIEFLRFLDATTDDLIESITALVGTNIVFIKGGAITQSGGNTTISDGIIVKDNKLYTFVGGTYAGTPATLKVLFSEATAAGFPQPYFVGDPIPKDVYLAKTSKVDATGTVFLNQISQIIPLGTPRYKDITSTLIAAPGFTIYPLTKILEHSDGTIDCFIWVEFTGAKPKGTLIVSGLPSRNGSLIPINCMLRGNTLGYVVHNNSVLSGSELKVQQDFPSGLSGGVCVINITYKKI